MRVLHVIPAVAERYGGPSAALRGMVGALAARGVEVTVATTDADGSGRLAVALEQPVVEDGATYMYFARTLPGEYKFSWPLTRWLWRNVRRFDVVHVHALFSYPTLPACRVSRRAGVPYVLRPLGTLGAWGLAHRGWKKRPYLALVERWNLREAAAIHVTSDAESEAVARLGHRATVRVIPLGVAVVDDRAIARRVDASRGELDAPDAPLRVLFLSRIHPVKQLELLFEAAVLAEATGGRAVAITIAGDGEPSYAARLRAVAETLPLRVPPRFLGHVEAAAKDAAFDDAHLFVLPSSHENFGIAAAEALARGLPVLLSEGVAIAGEVRAAGAGLVAPSTAEALAGALVEIGRAPAVLGPMSEAALALARRAYSWPRAASQLESLYREVTAPG